MSAAMAIGPIGRTGHFSVASHARSNSSMPRAYHGLADLSMATVPDVRDVGGADAQLLSQPSVCLFAGQNVLNILRRKFRVPMLHAGRSAALGRTVPSVVAARPDRKMVRVDAQGVVAGVHDDKPFWDRPLRAFVGVAMRADRHFARQEKNAVAVAVLGSRPEPAGFRFIDADKKNILRPKHRIGVELALCVHPCVAGAAKLSPNRRALPAANANDSSSRLIGHVAPLKRHFMSLPWERQL